MILFFALAAIVAGCERVEMEMPTGHTIAEANSQLVMKAGYYRSDVGVVQIEKDVATGFSVASKDSANKIVEATWTIGTKTYNGLNIFHKFGVLGQATINIAARFENNTTENRAFTIEVVNDLSAAGPLIIKANKQTDGSYDLWFGWDKRWLKNYTDTTWSVNGNVTKWTLVGIPNQSFILDSSGQPILTNDIGKYLGVWANLKAAGDYNIALVAKNGNWIDITGSPYAKTNDLGLAHFRLNTDGSITPQGDINPQSDSQLPGDSGDNYFRFNQVADASGMTTLFFHLDSIWTNKSFAIKEGVGGIYQEPTRLSAVENFPNWGMLVIPLTDLTGNVSGWRYGASIDVPDKYVENMKKSQFYDGYFKNIRLFLVQLQAVKKSST